MKYIIANWKAHKTVNQSIEWARSFRLLLESSESTLQTLQEKDTTIIICPPLPFLFYVKQILIGLPHVSFGVQDISQFEDGSHTGEITASMLGNSIQYAIIGHSERRLQLLETEEQISNKITQLKKNAITPILCIRNEMDTVYESATLVTFEPVGAIATGKNMDVAQVVAMKQKLTLQPHHLFIYGGSVNSENVKGYLGSDQIDGVLVGTDSLNAASFYQIIQAVTK